MGTEPGPPRDWLSGSPRMRRRYERGTIPGVTCSKETDTVRLLDDEVSNDDPWKDPRTAAGNDLGTFGRRPESDHDANVKAWLKSVGAKMDGSHGVKTKRQLQRETDRTVPALVTKPRCFEPDHCCLEGPV